MLNSTMMRQLSCNSIARCQRSHRGQQTLTGTVQNVFTWNPCSTGAQDQGQLSGMHHHMFTSWNMTCNAWAFRVTLVQDAVIHYDTCLHNLSTSKTCISCNMSCARTIVFSGTSSNCAFGNTYRHPANVTQPILHASTWAAIFLPALTHAIHANVQEQAAAKLRCQ